MDSAVGAYRLVPDYFRLRNFTKANCEAEWCGGDTGQEAMHRGLVAQ